MHRRGAVRCFQNGRGAIQFPEHATQSFADQYVIVDDENFHPRALTVGEGVRIIQSWHQSITRGMWRKSANPEMQHWAAHAPAEASANYRLVNSRLTMARNGIGGTGLCSRW